MPAPQNEGQRQSIFLVGAIIALFWFGGAFAYFWGYFRSTLFKLPSDEVVMLLAWLFVPTALILACAGLIHELNAPPRKRRKRKSVNSI